MANTSYRQLAENFVKTKSPKDYKLLHDKVRPGLENYVFNIVKDNEAKNDIVTDTLTRLWTKIDQYDPQYQITTWLYRIAFNESLGWIRQRNKKRSDRVQVKREAFEEAGLQGSLDHSRFDFKSSGNSKRLRVYSMRIRKLSSNFPEKKERKRILVSFDIAEKIVKKEYLEVVRELRKRIK